MNVMQNVKVDHSGHGKPAARGDCPSQLEVSVRVGYSDFFWSNAFIEPKRGKALPRMQLR